MQSSTTVLLWERTTLALERADTEFMYNGKIIFRKEGFVFATPYNVYSHDER